MGTSSQERCWGQNHREASSEGAGNWEHIQASSREAGVDASGWGGCPEAEPTARKGTRQGGPVANRKH